VLGSPASAIERERGRESEKDKRNKKRKITQLIRIWGYTLFFFTIELMKATIFKVASFLPTFRSRM
jgi:hypothetical protein